MSISDWLYLISSYQQYSQKEDKYEEEIKILTDKLKEVRIIPLSPSPYFPIDHFPWGVLMPSVAHYSTNS